MKTVTSLVFVALCGLLGSCTLNPHPMDMTQAVQSASTRSDHEKLAQHYEAAAKDLEAKVATHQRLLAYYEANQGLYGRQAPGLITHCKGLVAFYEQAAVENLRMAALHRQLAAGAPS